MALEAVSPSDHAPQVSRLRPSPEADFQLSTKSPTVVTSPVSFVSPAAARRGPRPLLLAIPRYWHLLSLDAPTVAVLWAWSFARVAQVRPSAAAVAILGLGTWLIYVADRLLDARAGAPRLNLRERHYFHRRHRRALLVSGSAAGLLMLLLIVLRMAVAARREDSALFAASMIYFGFVHRPRHPIPRWFRREFSVGIVFACATAVPALSQHPEPRITLLLPVLLFAALCTLNCLAIEEWEQPAGTDGPRFPVSLAALPIAAAAAALMLTSELLSLHAALFSAAALVSALLLLALDRLRRSAAVSALALRISADAALLTPLLLVLPWRR